MPPEPLTPEQVDALLRPDARTAVADLRVLRDALHRLGDAWERVATAAAALSRAADTAGERDRERRRPTPPRAD